MAFAASISHGSGVTSICARGPATKPFWGTDENILKQEAAYAAEVNQRGSTMLALILNAIYRQFLKAALPGMANKGAWQ
jgi:hypothetical protein